MDVKGKAAIVTGGGTGVGRATALSLAKLGCHVLVNYNTSAAAADEVVKAAREAGVEAAAVQADVADDAACRALVQAAVDRFGRLDVLVNNAGTTTFIPHDDMEAVDPEVWDRIQAVNVRGPFQCTRAARPHLAADGGGEVVNVTSVAGLRGMGSSIPYCASKAALNNLTWTLARVLGPQQIRVNAVAPGFIAGGWLEEGLGAAYEPMRKAFSDRSPLGRVSTAEDVAAAILGLVTGSDMVTGQIVACEGGMLLN